MRVSSKDADCRYIPAPGTKPSTPFGKFLSGLGLEFPGSLTLDTMVRRGWISPVLRVKLPRAAFEAWLNYPEIGPMDAESCPAEDRWALDLYVRAMTSGWPRADANWWRHEFDHEDSEIGRAARAHAFDPNSPDTMPPIFRHLRSNLEIRPWIDYFAYWQAFEIADYLRAMSYTAALTDEFPVDRDRVRECRAKAIDTSHEILTRRWENRRRVFDWLSRMRTVIGSSGLPDRPFGEQVEALRRVAEDANLTIDQMRCGARSTLLEMWSEWAGNRSPLKRSQRPLLHLLRQEIEYVIFYIECIGGKRVDFLDDFWSPPDRRDTAANLIDALPRKEELARRDFSKDAEAYVEEHRKKLANLSQLDSEALRRLIDRHWNRSRPLRRFALAFRRLHEQLGGEKLTAEESIVRQMECIEQFNLLAMHAERILSQETRERNEQQSYPDVRALAKECLNYILGKWGLLNGGFSADIQPVLNELMNRRTQLHELGGALPFVRVEEVNSGKPEADYLVAAVVNFVIARNYAAHHDAFDFDLVYPGAGDQSTHPGRVALESVLLVVIVILTLAD